jgi:cytosine deaminase
LLLRRALLADGSTVDVLVEGTRIAAIGPSGTVVPATPAPGTVAGSAVATTVDLDGALLLPAPGEPHAHLDKAFLAERIDNPTGDLMGAILAMQANRDRISFEDTVERAERAVHLLVRNGCTAIRTHADTTLDNGLRSVLALAEVRARVAELCDLQIAALCGWPVTGVAGADNRALLRDALDAGADIVGGCPHLDDDLDEATAVLLAIAADAGCAVDLHTDETLDPAKLALADLARRAPTAGLQGPVAASHCVSLGVQDEVTQATVAAAVAAAGISVITLPATNLYLQGRDKHVATPRGLTALAALRSAGVNIAAGGDNLQDPFNLIGRGDPLETAALMVLAAHYLPGDAYAAVSSGVRQALGLEPVALTVGAPAELLAVRAASVREAIAMQPAGRTVIHAGRVVAGVDAR